MHVKLRKSEGVEFFNNISAGNAFLMVFFLLCLPKRKGTYVEYVTIPVAHNPPYTSPDFISYTSTILYSVSEQSLIVVFIVHAI